MSKPTLNLKILLAVAIGGLVLVATLSVTVLHTVKFQNYARQEAAQQLNRAAIAIRAETERLLEPALAIAQHFAETSLGHQNSRHTNDRNTQFSRFLNAVEIIPFQNQHISSAYVGYDDGSFVILTKNTAALRKAVSLPQVYRSAYLRFERDTTAPKIVDRWSHRVDGNWQSIDFPKSSYEPRARPWYKLAQERAGQVWTNLYRFYGQHGFGITLVRGVRDKRGSLNAVLGVDIRLESLTEFIRSASVSPNGFAFVATQDGTLIAHPGLNAALLPNQLEKVGPHVSDMRTVRGRDAHVLQSLKSADAGVVTLDVDGKPYLAYRTSLASSLGMDASLYIAAPLSDFTAAATNATRSSLALAGLVTMLMLGFGTWIARAIARPVRQAAATMSAVSQLELRKNGAAGRSVLTEIDLLNHASNRMSSALSGFVRYVPSDVVRELLEHDQPIELGGTRRDITVLFTDIKDFTALAETEQPELLVSSLADYFDIIAEVVSATGGTIDKFMGDGVMAFWGAPRLCTNHSQRACDAVLEIAKRIDGLNEVRATANLPPLTTRFGLHRGDTFVGNVGARNRFGYTALGDVVNTAARLENANKDLKTQILVSDAVVVAAREAHHFVARDTIKLRGKSTQMDIYELSRSDASGTGPSLALAS